MAPTPIKGNKKAKLDLDVVEKAVEAVHSKAMGLRKAARHFGIALSTLADKVHGKSPLQHVPRTLLTQYEEERLLQWLLKMSELAFGQTTDDIRATAKAIIQLRGGTTKDPSNLPSTAWVYRFFQRHPELTLRTPMSLGKERALVTPPNVEKWFGMLKAYVDAQDPCLLSDPSRIFNADESGFSFDPKSRKVITWKGAKTVYNMTSNTKTQVTVLASMSAAGLYLPPLLIYPYKRIPGKNLLEGFPEALLQVSDNGWITSAIFFTWLRDSFIPATDHLQKPILLLVDGHVSHKSLLETSQICEENKIILFCFLAHASHVMQPLDQAFFGSIKAAWSAASRRHIAETGEAVGLDTFAKVFHGVWHSSATQANAESSYRAAGIYPFCPERVLQTKKLMPCQVFRDFVSTEPALPLPVEQETPSSSTEVEDVPPLASSHHPQESDEEPMPPSPFEYNDDSDPMSPCPSALPPLESFMEFSPAQEIQNLPPLSTPRQEEPSTILPTPSPAPTESVAPEPRPSPSKSPFQSPSPSKSPFQSPSPSKSLFQSPSPSKSLFQSPTPTKSPPLSPNPAKSSLLFHQRARSCRLRRCLSQHQPPR